VSKIIYHRGTGTYFDLEDDEVFIIDTDAIEGDDIDEMLDAYGSDIALGFGEAITGYVTDRQTILLGE
jgi:hypothetical protein